MESGQKPDLARKPLHEDVRHYVHEAIMQARLQPGVRIVESRLARELGISQAPVREALRELEQMGLVVHHPRRGATVRKITAIDAWEMYTLRAHLESMAARLALPRLSDEDIDQMEQVLHQMVQAAMDKDHQSLTRLDARFHELLCEKAGHQLLLRVWRNNNPLSWTLFTVVTLERYDLIELAERHWPILNALRSRDQAAVERAIQDHLLTLGQEVTQYLKRNELAGSE